MKQKSQTKQNTKKELKEILNWTSSAEIVAPDAPVTLHRSNQLASDTPVLCHRCNEPSNAQATGRNSSVTGCTGGVKIEASVQTPCFYSESMSSSRGEVLQHRLHRWSPEQGTGAILRQLQEREAAPDELVTKHRSNR